MTTTKSTQNTEQPLTGCRAGAGENGLIGSSSSQKSAKKDDKASLESARCLNGVHACYAGHLPRDLSPPRDRTQKPFALCVTSMASVLSTTSDVLSGSVRGR